MNFITEVTFIAAGNSLVDDRLEFRVEVDGEVYTDNVMILPDGVCSFIETEIKIQNLNSLNREKMMRVLEFIEIIEETEAELPGDLLEDSILILKENFRESDGWNFKVEWEYPRR